MKHNKVLGEYGERFVAEFLEKEGYKVIARNFKACGAEIDIIAQKEDLVAFVEVKTRENLGYGRPAEAVTKPKQKQIKKAAEIYLMKNEDWIGRFDVAEVIGTINSDGLDVLDFNYLENAFY